MSGTVQRPEVTGLTTPLRTPTGQVPATDAAAQAGKVAAPGGPGTTADQISFGAEAAARAAEAGPAPAPAGPLDLGSIFEKIKAILGKAVEIAAEMPAAWSLDDAGGLLTAIEAVPQADRGALGRARFIRTQTLPAHSPTEPNYGNVEFHSADKSGPLTIKLADIASRAGLIAKVAAHEIGHAVQGGGRWDADEIREFGKLSQWVLPGQPESLVNGYDKFHRTKDFEDDHGSLAVPKNKANLVSEFAAGSAAEDYAESYRTYLFEPAVLMAKAPEKFLYINATSGKYNASEVQRLAADSGADLALTMASLRRSTLRPETVERITRGNFLLGVGDSGTAAGDAISFIQERAGDAAFLASLEADPRSALGENVWNRLSTAEQRLLGQPDYVGRLTATVEANKLAPRDTVADSEVGAWKDFFADLADNPPSDAQKLAMTDDKVLGFVPAYWFGATPNKKPSQARFEFIWGKLHNPAIWNRMSDETRKLIDSPAGKKVIYALANDKSIQELSRKLWGGVKVMGFTVGGSPDPRYRSNVSKTISRIGPAEVQFTIDMVKFGLKESDLKTVGKITLDMARTGLYAAADGEMGVTAL